jgi:adenosylcobinamide-phosphate synthase
MNIFSTPLIVLFGAILFDLLLGELPNAIHPVVCMGSYIKFFWDKRLKQKKSLLFLSGVFLLLSGIILFSYFPLVLLPLLPPLVSTIISIVMLTSVFSIRALILAGREVKSALEKRDLMAARELTAWHLVSRDTSDLNEEEIVSSVIESLAENITDGFTSPLVFYSFGGIPGAWAYRFANTSDSMIAYRKGDFEWGGKTTAWLDSLLNWIPARLTGLLLCISAFIVKEDWKNSFKTMITRHGNTASPNAGWTMAAMAGALNITLEKRGDYILDGGDALREYTLIDRAIKIVIVTMIQILIVSIILLEVLN